MPVNHPGDDAQVDIVFEDVDIQDYVGVPEPERPDLVQWALVGFFCGAVGLFASVTWLIARRREPTTIVPLLGLALP